MAEGSLATRTSVIVLALVAASIVMAEVLLTRVLSFSTYYSVAFVVLSLAMLGLSAGSLDARRARLRGDPLQPWLARRLVHFAGALVFAAAMTTSIPLTFAFDLTSFVVVLLVAGACAAPMVTGGSIVARLLGESKVALPLLYGVDLACAALGALVPLVVLGPLSAPGALLALALVLGGASLVLAPKDKRSAAIAVVALSLGTLILTETTQAGLVVAYAKGTRRRDQEKPAYERWNALSHVGMRPFAPRSSSLALWGAAPTTPKTTSTLAMALIDGEAGTFVHAFDKVSDADILRYDSVTAAHRLRPSGSACVIGVGGGRDLLAALVYGHDSVLGVEVNPAILEMLHAAEGRAPLLADPRVRVIIGDGRTEMARSGVSCRVLQASLVDTWAATSAGAFAHTEATLYTLEAWRIFLRRVSPDGILTFSRWYNPDRPQETARLVSLAVAALLDRGVTNPRAHIALVAARNVATILVDPSPLAPEDLEAIHRLNEELKLTVLLAPDRPPSGGLVDAILDAPSIDALPALGAPLGLDTSAPTDDRPFFFQLRTASAWLHPVDMVRGVSTGGDYGGSATAMLQLLLVFGAVLVVGAVLLGPTLARAARSSSPPLPGKSAAVYFGALGAGFMMAEVALVQRMHVVLGHPTYALVVVLAGLLLATGIGSALSPRLVKTRRAAMIAALVAGALLLAIPYLVIRPLAHATVDSSLGLRAGWAGGTSALLGLVLGTLFPSGMRFVSREDGAPLALAINGLTSILGSCAALMISVWADIPTTFALAGVVYLVAALCAPARWKIADEA